MLLHFIKTFYRIIQNSGQRVKMDVKELQELENKAFNQIRDRKNSFHDKRAKTAGVMTQQILELEQEITKLNDTILWMHAAIWDTLGQNQKLKSEADRIHNSHIWSNSKRIIPSYFSSLVKV